MRPPAIADVQSTLFRVIDAAHRRGIRQIAFLSLQGVQANRKTPHHAVERYLRERKSPYTFLRPNFFMQNLSTTYAAPIRDRGEIFVPAGRSRTAFIDARDVGAVAAVTLTHPGHVGKAYTLSGEQSLTYREVAAVMSEVLGRPIRYDRPSEDLYLAQLAAQRSARGLHRGAEDDPSRRAAQCVRVSEPFDPHPHRAAGDDPARVRDRQRTRVGCRSLTPRPVS